MVKAIFKMKKVQILLAPGLVFLGFLALFIYQNCSKEAQFKSRAGVKRPPHPDDGPFIGGNRDVHIHFNDRPHDSTVNDPDPVIDYEVIPQDGTPVEVHCLLNGTPVECDRRDRIILDNLPPGPQEFVIVVTEGGPNGPDGGVVIVTEVVEWVIYERIVSMTKDIHVGQDTGSVDVIINVDNSGSMEFEQRSMSQKISFLITRIQSLDYHIAVTTTSPSDPQTWTDRLNYVDGKFVPFGSNTNVFCLRKGEYTEEQVRNMIQGAVIRDLHLRDSVGNPVINPDTGRSYAEGSGWERGIFTTYRAFERGVENGSPQNANCLRTGVPKHVILISDERETMEDNAGNPLPDLYKSNGANLRGLVARLYGSSTIFKFHSIIVNPYDQQEGAACLGTHGARPGFEYARLSLDTGGHIGSVCSSDYGSQLGSIGTQVANSKLSYRLDCVTVFHDGTYGSVVNISTGELIDREYSFRGDKVEFTTAPAPGDYRVSYYCRY